MNWRYLESESDWEEALKSSSELPIVVFKHSTRCSVSLMARKMLEQKWDFNEEEITPYFLDLIKFRNVSDRISHDTEVRHESPQLIYIKDGKVDYHASHYSIDTDTIHQKLEQ